MSSSDDDDAPRGLGLGYGVKRGRRDRDEAALGVFGDGDEPPQRRGLGAKKKSSGPVMFVSAGKEEAKPAPAPAPPTPPTPPGPQPPSPRGFHAVTSAGSSGSCRDSHGKEPPFYSNSKADTVSVAECESACASDPHCTALSYCTKFCDGSCHLYTDSQHPPGAWSG